MTLLMLMNLGFAASSAEAPSNPGRAVQQTSPVDMQSTAVGRSD